MLPEMKRIPEDDYDQRRQLMADGWREIEVLETYRGKRRQRWKCRPADIADVPRVVEIAERSFKFDRLHTDEAIEKADADQAKVRAVLSALGDSRKKCYVCGDPVQGFIIVEFTDDPLSADFRIDLIAVDDSYRSGGVGRSLILSLVEEAGAQNYEASTQMTNEPAKRLYESLGMTVVKRERTFHK